MAISRQGAASAQAQTITIPTHAAGDLILIAAARSGSNSQPTIPSGYITIYSSSGASSLSHVIAAKIAKTSSETSGTFTNATVLHCWVYRGSAGIVVPNFTAPVGSASSTSVSYSGSTAYRAGVSDSWYAGFAIMANSANSLETAPTGMTNINSETDSSTWKSAAHDTNGTLSSNWSTQTVTVTNSAAWRTHVVHIVELDSPSYGSSSAFRPVNIRGGADQ